MSKALHNKPRVRHHASIAKFQNAEELAMAFNASPYPQTITKFENGRYLSVNDSFVEATGWQRDEVIGHTSLEIGILADKSDRHWLTQTLSEQGRLNSQKMRFRIKRGDVRTGLFSAEIVEVGGEHCILSLVTDITGQLEVEARNSEQAQMLNMIQDSVIALDQQLRITYWNRAAEQLLGWSAGEAIGQPAHRLLFPESETVFAEALCCIKQHGTWHGEVSHRARDGSDRVVKSRWLAIRDERSMTRVEQPLRRSDGKGIASLIIVSTDITEQKRLTADLDRATRLALAGRMASSLAHEIKNPLAGIKGVADAFLEHRQLTTLERGWMEGVRHQVARIDTRVRSLLDLSQPRSFNVKQSSLEEVVRAVVLLARHHAAVVMETKGHRISVDFIDAVGEPLMVSIDSAQIEEAILNLVLNAIDSIQGAGRITIRLRRRHRRKESRLHSRSEAVVEVIDTGSGITLENRGRVFDPFFTTKRDGAGLGLAAVRSAAEAHGGRVTFKTRVGVGSCFVLAVPLQPHPVKIDESQNDPG